MAHSSLHLTLQQHQELCGSFPSGQLVAGSLQNLASLHTCNARYPMNGLRICLRSGKLTWKALTSGIQHLEIWQATCF